MQPPATEARLVADSQPGSGGRIAPAAVGIASTPAFGKRLGALRPTAGASVGIARPTAIAPQNRERSRQASPCVLKPTRQISPRSLLGHERNREENEKHKDAASGPFQANHRGPSFPGARRSRTALSEAPPPQGKVSHQPRRDPGQANRKKEAPPRPVANPESIAIVAFDMVFNMKSQSDRESGQFRHPHPKAPGGGDRM